MTQAANLASFASQTPAIGGSPCVAWCNYNGSTQVIANSFNISSVTRQSAGIYTFNFATTLAGTPASVAISGSAGYWTIVSTGGITTTSATFASYINGTGYADNTPFCMVAFSK